MTLPPITPVRPPQSIGDLRPSGSATGAGSTFQSAMATAFETVDSIQKDANASVQRFLNGEGDDLHKVALDQQRASLAFDMFLQVRNKVISAYQEVMRMQV